MRGDRARTTAPSRAPAALEAVMPEVYEELRRLAVRAMHSERGDHTLQPTALVHEAYLRLRSAPGLPVDDRLHLLALAARTMRRVLVDHARAHQAAKRGGERVTVTLTGAMMSTEPSLDLLALDEALERLQELDPRQVRVVELRFLAGLSVEETAAALGVSTATVKRESAIAKAWLYRELSREP